MQRMPGSEMYPGLTAASWPATHTALAHSALGLTAGLCGPPETPGAGGHLDLPRPTQPCPESRDLVKDRRPVGWFVGAAQLGGGSPRMGGGCIPAGWWVPLAGWWAHSSPPALPPPTKSIMHSMHPAPRSVQRLGSAQRDAPQRAGSILTRHARGNLEGREGMAGQMAPVSLPAPGWVGRCGWAGSG